MAEKLIIDRLFEDAVKFRAENKSYSEWIDYENNKGLSINDAGNATIFIVVFRCAKLAYEGGYNAL